MKGDIISVFKKPVCFACIILLLISLSCCQGGSGPKSSAISKSSRLVENEAKRLNEYIAEKIDEGGIPGLAATVVVKGNVVWSNGFGLADKENGTPFTADTVMNIASVSKTVLGCSVMIAVERGLVDLDEDVNTYLKDFSVHNPYNEGDTITLRELATHTSGIIDKGEVYGNTYFAGEDSPVSLEDFITNYLSTGGSLYDKGNFLDTSQGSVYYYSNIGAAFAAYILECATSQSFVEFTRENIFKPLGMDDTSWLLADTDITNHATVYDEEGTAVRPYGLTTYPDGGLRTSANDFGKFLAMVMNGGAFNGVRVMQESSVDEMLRPQFDKGNKPESLPLPNEGVFWQTDVSSTDMIGHTGGDVGVCTYMSFIPDEDIGVIVLANSSGTDNVVEAMKQIINELMENAYKISGI